MIACRYDKDYYYAYSRLQKYDDTIRANFVYHIVNYLDHLYIEMIFFFFFSSRRRHTRCLSDWSSDVCSSDLINLRLVVIFGNGSPRAGAFPKITTRRRFIQSPRRAVTSSPGNRKTGTAWPG